MSTLTASRPRPGIRPAAAVGMVIKGVCLLVFTWLFVWPLGMLIYGAFNSSPLSGRSSWTLEGFRRVITDPDTYGSLGATMVYSVVITVLSMAVAIFFATVTTRMDVPFRRLITPAMVILVAMPTVLYSLSWAMLGAGQAGMINRFLDAIGLEALFGALYLLGRTERINELFVTVMEELYGI